MNYGGIIFEDVANGLGIRTSLFVSGCRNNCPGCFNKEAQDFNFGMEFTQEVINKILNSIDDEYHAGITILGGEPLEAENLKDVKYFIESFRHKFGDTKNIWLYTGYIFEDIIKASEKSIRKQIAMLVDVIVDGPFILEKKTTTLPFRGSSNQRIIDSKASIKAGEVIIYNSIQGADFDGDSSKLK